MGCCISKNPTRQSPKPSDTPPRLLPPPALYYAGLSPVPPASSTLLEEEAVKEIVVSETPPPPPPVPKPRPPAEEDDSPTVAARPLTSPSPTRPKPAPQVFGQPLTPTPRKLDAGETDILISRLEEVAGVVSEYSDTFTLSGSLSVSTTPTTGTATTLNDSEVTSKVTRLGARTLPNRVPRKRTPVVGRDERPDRGAVSHTRRLQQPSPDRGRRGASQGRDMGGVRRNAGQAVGRDPRRRSSSPAQGRAGEGVRDGMEKIPVKRTGSTGYRSWSSLSGPGTENGSNPERYEKRSPDDEWNEGGKESRNDDVRRGNGDDEDNAACESLDNPNVSLECFIFL